MRRVAVVGSTGSGKTTFARRLAERIGAPHVDCDALAWGPQWTIRPDDEFRALTSDATSGDRWVTDGNYGRAGVRDMIWRRADTLVWLDYALPLVFWRLLRRTLSRIRSGEELWPGTGNRETIRGSFFSRESLFIWLLRSFWRRRRQFPVMLARPEYAHLTVHRFRAPAEAERWLETQRAHAAPRI